MNVDGSPSLNFCAHGSHAFFLSRERLFRRTHTHTASIFLVPLVVATICDGATSAHTLHPPAVMSQFKFTCAVRSAWRTESNPIDFEHPSGFSIGLSVQGVFPLRTPNRHILGNTPRPSTRREVHALYSSLVQQVSVVRYRARAWSPPYSPITVGRQCVHTIYMYRQASKVRAKHFFRRENDKPIRV